jgi:hypothetical protein
MHRGEEGAEKTSTSSKQETSSEKDTSLFEECYPVTSFVNFPKGNFRRFTGYINVLTAGEQAFPMDYT